MGRFYLSMTKSPLWVLSWLKFPFLVVLGLVGGTLLAEFTGRIFIGDATPMVIGTLDCGRGTGHFGSEDKNGLIPVV